MTKTALSRYTQLALRDEFIRLYAPVIIFLGTAIIYLCILKDYAQIGFNWKWLLIRLAYLPFVASIWALSKPKLLESQYYEVPLWLAGLYIAFFCAYFSFSTGGLNSNYVFGLIQFYFVISVMPLTEKTFYGLSLSLTMIYLGMNIFKFGAEVLSDHVMLTAMLPLLIFSPIIHVITSRIRLSKIKLQKALTDTLAERDEIIKLQAKELADIETKAAVGLMMAQVVHDIRSPLAVLNMISSGLLKFNAETQLMIRNAISRINEIANNLLIKFKGNQEINQTRQSVQQLIKNVGRIIAEKRLQYQGSNVDFQYDIQAYVDAGEVDLPSSDFMRILSNLLNNAVESLDKSGDVKVVVGLQDRQLRIDVIDNGCGMAPSVLKNVYQQGQTTKA